MYGVRGRQYDWFASFLQDRKQLVQIGDEKSNFLIDDLWCTTRIYLRPLIIFNLYQ